MKWKCYIPGKEVRNSEPQSTLYRNLLIDSPRDRLTDPSSASLPPHACMHV